MTKCKHKWVDMEDGTLDQFCVRCRKFQMRAVLNPLGVELESEMSISMGLETIEMPFYNGSERKRVTVYKDSILKQMNKELGIPRDFMNSMRR